ncbi:hypothetical protein Y032_0036g3159 [Ancylostoma ceylanicum]|uniref:TIL domain-containing protein n=1 Tax=Ancylostoma ceylanicum TaxID=53326 RepID=A0A016UKU3_9BILA|nr:hypothetical protein Y032_0036g3159 [Ancylostoma ceylanicum]
MKLLVMFATSEADEQFSRAVDKTHRCTVARMAFNATGTMKLIILVLLLAIACSSFGSRIMRGKRRRRCGKNEVYRRNFDGCEATCEEPHLICPDIGYNDEVAGCACKEGYLRNKDDKCVPEECANEFQGESSEENSSWGKKRVCGRNEIFRYCFDGCEPTCEEPERRCSQVCRFVGCACKKPYLRNENGECVPRNVCTSYRS